MEIKELNHVPVLVKEFIEFAPKLPNGGRYLDVTAGGGGHLSYFLTANGNWQAEAWDRDPEAQKRVIEKLTKNSVVERCQFYERDFGQGPRSNEKFYDYILADLGVSSFQLDDMSRGMSLHSEESLDFRMDPNSGFRFVDWLEQQEERKLTEILYRYGEEPRAQFLAKQIKQWGQEIFQNAKTFSDQIARTLNYKEASRKHPATRIFQALRIAINDEMGQLDSLLEWAPRQLTEGGRLAIMTFHSLEDRRVKHAYKELVESGKFQLLTKKPIVPSFEEETINPRSRSVKMRILEKIRQP